MPIKNWENVCLFYMKSLIFTKIEFTNVHLITSRYALLGKTEMETCVEEIVHSNKE